MMSEIRQALKKKAGKANLLFPIKRPIEHGGKIFLAFSLMIKRVREKNKDKKRVKNIETKNKLQWQFIKIF